MTGEDAIREAVFGAALVDIPPGDVDEIDYKLARFAKNDLGNAKRLLARFGRDLLNVKGVGWYAWTGTHWSLEHGEREAQKAAHQTVMGLYREAAAIQEAGPDDGEGGENWQDRIEKHRRWATQAGNTNRISGMLREAAPYLTVDMDDLDADPLLFCVRNGTLELRADVEGGIRFREHRREDMITRIASVEFQEHADAPEWWRFLSMVQSDKPQQLFLQRCYGYGLTGLQDEQKLVLHHGGGSNGKSTFVETLEALFGNYAMRLPFASLLQDDRRTGAQATPDLAGLPGRRLVVASESEEGFVFSSARIKDLTERREMKVRHLNQNFFEFTPQHKLTLMFNAKPVVKSTDDGTWRRMLLVPWLAKFVEPWEADQHPGLPVKDYDLPTRLLEELPGILNWLLDGWREYQEKGLKPPDSVHAATQEYRRENDPVGEFVRSVVRHLEPSVGAWMAGKELYQAYEQWAEQSGLRPWTNAAFGRRAKQLLRSETKGVVRYLDIELDPEWLRAWGRAAGGSS